MPLFGNKNNQPEGITWDPDAPAITQEEYENFMNGFRRGFPVEGDPEPIIPENPSERYLEGLENGRQAYEENEARIHRPWWKFW